MRTDASRWAILLIVLAIAGSGLFYQYQQTRPCIRPISYAIGNLDPRFNVSTSTVLREAAAAAAIWNKAAGKIILRYEENAPLKIHFFYDEREENAQLGSAIAREQAAQDVARTDLNTLQNQLLEEQKSYNRDVGAINARGGATRAESEALKTRKQSLERLSAEINAKVSLFNAGVAAINAKVAEYNRSAGRTFKEGEYVRDAASERITVFEFIGTTQLKRVLAHEFGHAIGLDHNDNPDSIMFAENESGNLVPTKADLDTLAATCGLN